MHLRILRLDVFGQGFLGDFAQGGVFTGANGLFTMHCGPPYIDVKTRIEARDVAGSIILSTKYLHLNLTILKRKFKKGTVELAFAVHNRVLPSTENAFTQDLCCIIAAC